MAIQVGESNEKKTLPFNLFSKDTIQNEKIKRVVSEILIILAAVTFVGTAIALFIPITMASLTIIASSIFTAFVAGLILLPNNDANLLTPSPVAEGEEKALELLIEDDIQDPNQCLELISNIFQNQDLKLYYFLRNRSRLNQTYIELGKDCFNKNLIAALKYAKKLDDLCPTWDISVMNDISQKRKQEKRFKELPLIDEKIASLEELKQFNKGLPNPLANCFMNASLQALFQNKQLSTTIITQLETIARSDKYSKREAIIPENCVISYEPPSEATTLKEAKKLLIDRLIKEQDLSKIETLDSYDFEEILKQDLTSTSIAQRLFITSSLKDAAGYSLTILLKWQKGDKLSHNETALLRLSLIKLMNRAHGIVLSKTTFRDTVAMKARWKIAGKDTDLKIDQSIQEDASLFSTNLLESLNKLSHTIDRELPPSPYLITIDRQIQVYKIPQKLPSGDWETPLFDKTLAIEKAKTHYTQILFNHITSAKDNQVFKLDDTSFLSEYKSKDKPEVFYKTESDLLPETKIGDIVSERYTYSIGMPENLISTLKIFEYSDQGPIKYSLANLEFTDEKNLTVTFAKSEGLLEKDHTYSLNSFIIHTGGNSINSGHYYTYTRAIRDSDKSSYWIKQNDESIAACSYEEPLSILKGLEKDYTPYVLFWSKIK